MFRVTSRILLNTVDYKKQVVLFFDPFIAKEVLATQNTSEGIRLTIPDLVVLPAVHCACP